MRSLSERNTFLAHMQLSLDDHNYPKHGSLFIQTMAFQPSPDQWTLSEQLQLLHELQYSVPDMPHLAARLHTDKSTRAADTNTDMRILDVIALALTTGDGDTLVGSGEG